MSATDGGIYLSQYFERARFEHHPEYQPPYNVLLGLLARETTHGRENEAPSRPVARPPASPDYDYFPETGHTLRGGFRAYWQAQGGIAELRLSDHRGISGEDHDRRQDLSRAVLRAGAL